MTKNVYYLLITCFILTSFYGNAQSIAFDDDLKANGETIEVCEGKSVHLKALNFEEGELKFFSLIKRNKYRWTIPDKARKSTKKSGFEITIDKVKVEHSGDYIVKDKITEKEVKVTVKVNKNPKPPAITYLLTESKLFIADTSSNIKPASIFKWTLPTGDILMSSQVPRNVKEFEVSPPKVTDLGTYKLNIKNGDGCSSESSVTVIPKQLLPKAEVKSSTDTTKNDWFFYGNIGGSADLINRGLGINSVYTDIQFRPSLKLNSNFKLKFPIRIYYNNGSGPQQSDAIAPQRFTTIDTVTLAKTKKVRFLVDEPLLTNKVESRIIGLNIPISYSYKLPSNDNWSFILGLNMDFNWITNRTFGYAFTGGDSTFIVANAIPSFPTSISQVAGDGSVITRNNNIRYDSLGYRPRVPVDRQYTYSQLFIALQVGIEHQSPGFDFSLKYSYGNVSSYMARSAPTPGGYNHNFQMIFFEKKIGIQLLADIRLANITQDGNGTLVASSAPYYYISAAKTINLSALKELFFK